MIFILCCAAVAFAIISICLPLFVFGIYNQSKMTVALLTRVSNQLQAIKEVPTQQIKEV